MTLGSLSPRLSFPSANKTSLTLHCGRDSILLLCAAGPGCLRQLRWPIKTESKAQLVFAFFAVTSGIGTWLCWNLFRSEHFLFPLALLSPVGVIVFGAATLYPALLRQLEEDFEYVQEHNQVNPNPTPDAKRLQRLFGLTWVAGLAAGAIHWYLLTR